MNFLFSLYSIRHVQDHVGDLIVVAEKCLFETYTLTIEQNKSSNKYKYVYLQAGR